VGNNLVAKIHREKCVSGEAQKTIGNVEDRPRYETLWIHATIDHKSPRLRTLNPIFEFSRYRMADSTDIR
jgi:hypothetical protein